MKSRLITAVMMLSGIGCLHAVNPIIQTNFTPDPAPYVHGDTVYLFVDHDENDAQYFLMEDWQLYSTDDMVNWTYRGTPISTGTFSWATQGDKAWASQAIERDGKWYWYICAQDAESGLDAIGVAVADAPEGPYRDALGCPLTKPGFGFIDPSVFIDDDGQAYLFWGNNGLWMAKLNRDMISFDGEIRYIDELDDEKAFGPKVMKRDYALNKRMLKSNFEEAPWVSKRNGIYYLVYAAGGVPEFMAYSTAENINGPWTYRGRIMNEAENSFTIHGGLIEIGGRNFMFYHNGKLPNGGGFRRSSCVEEFSYGDDGSIPFMPFTNEGVKTPLKNLNPYVRVEAETMADSYGVRTDRNKGTERHYLKSVDNGDWIMLRSVDFGKGGAGRRFVANVSALRPGSSIEVRIDALGNKPVAQLEVKPTGCFDKWQEQSAEIGDVEGVHDVYLLFRGDDDSEVLRCDYWILK